MIRNSLLLTAFFGALATHAVALADISDFTQWDLYGDPVSANMGGSSGPDTATLTAVGPISSGTDVGFSSVDARTIREATQGYYFEVDSDFEIAIDYDLSHIGASGGFGLGFGIGEERTGENSAGMGLLTNDGDPFLTFAAAARINDVTQTAQITNLPSTLAGSMFVAYEAATGNITLGASTAQDAATPEVVATYEGIQNSWNNNSLIANFFVRSQSISFFAPDGFEAGTAEATFTNFRVIRGNAIAVPEPGSISLIYLISLGLCLASHSRSRSQGL